MSGYYGTAAPLTREMLLAAAEKAKRPLPICGVDTPHVLAPTGPRVCWSCGWAA